MENQRKERKSFRKVFLIIPMLFLTIATLSVVTYAFWNSLTANKDVTVEVGEGASISVSSTDASGELVPEGTVTVAKQVTSITINNTVNVVIPAEISETEAFILNIEKTDVVITGLTETELIKARSVIIVELDKTQVVNITENSTYTVVATIKLNFAETLTEAEKVDIANLIKGKAISFTINFTLVAPVTIQPTK